MCRAARGAPAATIDIMLGDLYVVPQHVALLRSCDLTSLAAVLAASESSRLDKPGLPSWRRRDRIELQDEDGTQVTLYAKCYVSPPFPAQIARWFGGVATHGTAWIEWQWMHRLAADGIAAMRPVAFGESMKGCLERGSALLTEAVAGESLERWADGRTTRCPREMIQSLAGYVRRFHDRGYAHRDLYLCHIFIDESAGGEARFRMIDLQRVIRPIWRRDRWVVKDLAALDYSTPSRVAGVRDRVRFLKTYLGVGRLGTRGRRLGRRIAEKSARIGRHDGRRTARLGGSGGPNKGGV